MTQTQTTIRPLWASAIAIGFLAAGIGALLLALGMITGGAIASIGSALLALGVAIGAFGGYGYFLGIRR